MFFRSATLVFAGLLSVQQAAAVKELIDKPLIQPPFMGLDNGAGLWKFLKPTQSTYTLWGWGCKSPLKSLFLHFLFHLAPPWHHKRGRDLDQC